jgi:hypothetical protein
LARLPNGQRADAALQAGVGLTATSGAAVTGQTPCLRTEGCENTVILPPNKCHAVMGVVSPRPNQYVSRRFFLEARPTMASTGITHGGVCVLNMITICGHSTKNPFRISNAHQAALFGRGISTGWPVRSTISD